MNLVVLIGRLTKDVTVRQTEGGTMIVSGTVAVTKTYKNADDAYGTNFINFIATKGTAELINKYFKKGDRIGLTGSWETSTYESHDGRKYYNNDLFVNNVDFLQEKKQEQTKPNENFSNASSQNEINDKDLPF